MIYTHTYMYVCKFIVQDLESKCQIDKVLVMAIGQLELKSFVMFYLYKKCDRILRWLLRSLPLVYTFCIIPGTMNSMDFIPIIRLRSMAQ